MMSEEKAVSTNTDSKQYIIFDLDNEEYGINIEVIESINRMINITRVPKAPNYVNGVINVRGDIIPVMSLRKKLNFSDDEFTNFTRIIILKDKEESIAVLVDKVKEVVEIETNDIDSVQEVKIGSSFVKGIGKINSRIVTLLNIEKLIESIE